jgi:hypothetical protein
MVLRLLFWKYKVISYLILSNQLSYSTLPAIFRLAFQQMPPFRPAVLVRAACCQTGCPVPCLLSNQLPWFHLSAIRPAALHIACYQTSCLAYCLLSDQLSEPCRISDQLFSILHNIRRAILLHPAFYQIGVHRPACYQVSCPAPCLLSDQLFWLSSTLLTVRLAVQHPACYQAGCPAPRLLSPLLYWCTLPTVRPPVNTCLLSPQLYWGTLLAFRSAVQHIARYQTLPNLIKSAVYHSACHPTSCPGAPCL